jgi:2-C-methyl-D-erythritol 4-phosphate cytidylyltransferase
MESAPPLPQARRAVAVLLAGGVGARAGLGMPKQFAELHGRTILEHSLAALHDHPAVSGVLVVMAPGYVDAARVVTADYARVLAVIDGGAERSDSTVRALEWLAAADISGDVLIHDAARPLLTAEIIDRCITALETAAAVGVAVPSSDTIFRTDAAGRIVEVPPRSELWRAQTPQSFHLATLRAAYDVALADPGFEATDDCSVVRRYLPDVPVVIVPGDERNMKVTGPLDLAIAERLLTQP